MLFQLLSQPPVDIQADPVFAANLSTLQKCKLARLVIWCFMQLLANVNSHFVLFDRGVGVFVSSADDVCVIGFSRAFSFVLKHCQNMMVPPEFHATSSGDRSAGNDLKKTTFSAPTLTFLIYPIPQWQQKVRFIHFVWGNCLGESVSQLERVPLPIFGTLR